MKKSPKMKEKYTSKYEENLKKYSKMKTSKWKTIFLNMEKYLKIVFH